MQACKPIDTLIKKGNTLSLDMYPKTLNEKENMAPVSYANVVGSLMYAMMCTRPDIYFTVGFISRFQANPGLAH